MEQGARGKKTTLCSSSFAKGWRKREKKNKDKRQEFRAGFFKKAVPVNVCSKWRMDVIGQPCQREREGEHSMFSAHSKLCITVIPSTTHRQADKGRIH